MKKLLAILTLAALTACGGGGSSAVGSGTTVTPPTTIQNNAKSTLSFSFPLGNGTIGTAPQSSLRHPMFIDGNASNGSITLFFDGVPVMKNVSFGTNGAGATGPAGSTSLGNGGNFSYTTTITQGSGNQPWATVTGTFNTFAGNHTIGVVQTNGPCLGAATTCIPGNDGYVLAEGQKTFTLQAGSANNLGLFLRGVMESAYICDFAADGITPLCDGHIGTVQPDGSYPLYVVVADENGTGIVQQSDGTNILGFDNGNYQIVETPAKGIVSITQDNHPLGTFTHPGTSRHGLYGEAINVKCINPGSTTIAVQNVNGTSAGSVTGFTYDGHYPTAGSIFGPVGADLSFGNSLSFSCDASGTLTIQ